MWLSWDTLYSTNPTNVRKYSFSITDKMSLLAGWNGFEGRIWPECYSLDWRPWYRLWRGMVTSDNSTHLSESSTHGERLWLTPSTRIQTSEQEREFIGTNIKQFPAKKNYGAGTPKKTCKTGCRVGRPSKVS